MRSLILGGAALIAGAAAAPATAAEGGRQAMGGWHGPAPMTAPAPRPQMPQGWHGTPHTGGAHNGTWHGGGRWGGKTGGHWSGGMNAPGGWNAYHRPSRGWRVPRYWIAPTFFITDFGTYGLGQPPYGYNWSRYYDDAVLIDRNGQVWDSVSGIDWDRYDGGYADDGYGYEGDDGYAGDDGYRDRDGHWDRHDGDRDRDYGCERRSDGTAGAIVGGIVGGVAGHAIAGRHDKTVGTLAGAALGAGAGYAIDRGGDRDDRCGPPHREYHGAGYPPPSSYHTLPDGTQVWSTTSSAGGGYIRGGYWYPPVTTTIVTVQTLPVVTTTTTEYVTERSYRRTPACGCGKAVHTKLIHVQPVHTKLIRQRSKLIRR